ncbi:MAG TPA: hypothetical protein VNV35_10650, partial [Puia sp.]|nr:hypothetical protein [Puia sp.]
MKCIILFRSPAGLLWSVPFLWALASCSPPVEVPADPQTTNCSISASTIAGWFQSGTVTLNGTVNPANSILFPGTPNCSFYQWSEQMFLWMTSPTTSIYGGSGRIFESPVFFDVSPPDPSSGMRTLIQHTPGLIRAMAVRAAQAGPHHLPAMLNKAGKLIEIEPTPTAPNGKQLILNRAGQPVEIEEIRESETGRAVFLGKDKQPIEGAHPLFKTERVSKNIVQRFIFGHRPIFLDAAGDVVDVEEGEADNGVLMSQGNSLIYYVVLVNDVYAYFRTGTHDGNISAFHFPTSQSDLSPITALGATKNLKFPDSVALAVELKTAWVLASSVSNPNDYITITAAVPHYNQTSTQWTLVPNVLDTVQLAMIGAHVVGSVAGHAEMIWATFVHDSIAPDSTYTYTNSSNSPTVVPVNTTGSWVLCANGAAGQYNQMRQTFDLSTGNIVATSGNTIGPSNILTMKPWGAGSDLSPNPIDGSSAASNAEILSVNNNVQDALIAGDPR